MSALVAWWKGENNALDSSGNNLNGVWGGITGWSEGYVAGVVGNAFSFNGKSKVTVAYNTLFSFLPTNSFTVRCYFNYSNLNPYYNSPFIMCRGVYNNSAGLNRNWKVRIYDAGYDTYNRHLVFNCDGYEKTSVDTISANVSHKLVAQYVSGVWQFWLDDVLVTWVSSPSNITSLPKALPTDDGSPLVFGSSSDNTWMLIGSIDEIKIYDDSTTTPTPNQTYQRLILDAGQIRVNYVDADNPGFLIGSTRGGSTFSIQPDYKEMLADGARGPVMGSKRFQKITAKLTVNMIEIVPWILSAGLPGSTTLEGSGHSEIARMLGLLLSDYKSSIAFLAQVSGSNQPIVCGLKNVIVDSGLEISAVDLDESVVKLEFTAHFDPSTGMDDEPWFVRFPLDVA